MARRVRKEVQAIADELASWLPNYDHGPGSFPELVWRLLASIPGGEQAEDMGYEPLGGEGGLGWKEVELLGDMLNAIQDKTDAEDLVELLMAEDDEEGEGEEDDEEEEDEED